MHNVPYLGRVVFPETKMKIIMNRIIKISTLSLFSIIVLAACQREFQFEFAQSGPDMVISCDESVNLGGKIDFTVDITDDVYPLSQLTVSLYADLDVEGSAPVPEAVFVTRTKDPGTYAGKLTVPFSQNTRNGNMALVFEAVNTHLGYTYDTLYVAVSRPEYEYLTLKMEDGSEHRMEKKQVTSTPAAFSDSYWYGYTGNFPAECKAVIVAPKYEDVPEMTFGWGGTGIQPGKDEYITFSNGLAGDYEVAFNTFSWDGSPFVVLEVNGVQTSTVAKDKYAAVVELGQNDEILIEGYAAGFEGWTIDADYMEMTDSDGKFKFLAVDGQYKFIIETKNEFIRVERMKNNTDLATLNEDGTGAVWLIGNSKVGKPTMAQGADWNPENGGLCLAEVSPKVHQITLVAGVQLSCDNVNFKFFHQKTWGGEFGFDNISTDSDTFYVSGPDSDSGNIFLKEGKTLNLGDIWRFTVDLTGYSGGSGAVLKAECIGRQEFESEVISFAGVELEMTSADQYQGIVTLEKDQVLTFTGIDDEASWYMDPDYLAVGASGLTWKPVSGTYKVTVNTAVKYASFSKVKADGTDATLDEGALWLMGWGTAHPYMASQMGWTPGAAYCMAEVSPRVYQVTGTAVADQNSTVMGGRFRTDYLSFKYFFQNGWGGEKGQAGTVVLTESAAAYLADNGNLELATGVLLEEGATYVLTIDLSTEGTETIDFVKK